MSVNYVAYNKALIQLLQVICTCKEVNAEEYEDYLMMAQVAVKRDESTSLLYKKSGPLLRPYASKVYGRDDSLMTDTSMPLPEVLASFRPVWSQFSAGTKERIWRGLEDAVSALGCSPPPPIVSPAPAAVVSKVESAVSVLPPIVSPAPAVVSKAESAKTEVTVGQKQNEAAGGIVVAQKTAENKKSEKTGEEARPFRQPHFREIFKNEPALTETLRAVQSFVKDGKSDTPEIAKVLETLEAAKTNASSASSPSTFSLLAGCSNILKHVFGEEGEQGPSSEVPPPPVQENDDVKKAIAHVSIAQQFHVTFFKYYRTFTEFRGLSFPKLEAKYYELRDYVAAITKLPEGPAEYKLLKETVEFFKTYRRQIKYRDEKLFTEPTYALFREMGTAEIWASLKESDRTSLWTWFEEIRNIAYAANICSGSTMGFESLAKSLLPAIAFTDASENPNENWVKRFMSVMQQPQHTRAFRELIQNFKKEPTQVTKAVDLINAAIGGDDSDEEQEEKKTESKTESQPIAKQDQKT